VSVLDASEPVHLGDVAGNDDADGAESILVLSGDAAEGGRRFATVQEDELPRAAMGDIVAQGPAGGGEKLVEGRGKHGAFLARNGRALKWQLANGARRVYIPLAMNPEIQKHLEYATGFLDLKMLPDALVEVDTVLALEPHNPHAVAIKSAILWHQNKLREAEPFVAELAEMNPRDAGIWINLAYIRRRTQSLDAAVDTLQHAFAANPAEPLAHFNMACYRAVQNRTEEALELLRSALHLDPKLCDVAQAEPDLENLRELPAFQKLIGG
jgi:tetratricopeptide (TPR) repeat protein